MNFDHFGEITSRPLDRGEIADLIACAHDHGLAVMAHANGAQTVSAALDAGVDSIEHGAYMDAECVSQLRRGAAQVWTPTLATIGNLIGCGRYPDDVLRPLPGTPDGERGANASARAEPWPRAATRARISCPIARESPTRSPCCAAPSEKTPTRSWCAQRARFAGASAGAHRPKDKKADGMPRYGCEASVAQRMMQQPPPGEVPATVVLYEEYMYIAFAQKKLHKSCTKKGRKDEWKKKDPSKTACFQGVWHGSGERIRTADTTGYEPDCSSQLSYAAMNGCGGGI